MHYPLEEQRKDNDNLAFAFKRSIKEGTVLHYYNQTHQNEYVGRVIEAILERCENGPYYTKYKVQVLNDDGTEREGFTDTAYLQHIHRLISI